MSGFCVQLDNGMELISNIYDHHLPTTESGAVELLYSNGEAVIPSDANLLVRITGGPSRDTPCHWTELKVPG